MADPYDFDAASVTPDSQTGLLPPLPPDQPPPVPLHQRFVDPGFEAQAQATGQAQQQQAVAQQQSQRKQQNLIRAEDLASRGVPSFKSANGDVSEVKDQNGAPLSNYDRKSGIAWDASGQPKAVNTSVGFGQSPTLDDPFKGVPNVTDSKTGDQYQIRQGLPWKWTGVDQPTADAAKQKAVDKLNQQTAEALGGPISQIHAGYNAARVAAKQSQQALTEAGVMPYDATGKPVDFAQMDAGTLQSHIDQQFNQRYAAPEANEHGWFGGDLSPTAQALRDQIDADKAKAMDAAQKHVQNMGQVQQYQDALQRMEAQRQALQGDRLERINQERVAAGLPPVETPGIPGVEHAGQQIPGLEQGEEQGQQIPGLEGGTPEEQSENSIPGVSPSGDGTAFGARQQNTKGSSPSTPNVHPDLQQAVADAKSGKKPYAVDDKGALQFQPDKLADGLKQAVADGIVDKEWAAKHQDDFRAAQDKYQELEKAAGGSQLLKTYLHAGGIGAAFGQAAVVGGRLGAAAGALIPGLGETGIGEIAGGALGALTTGTIAAWGARKVFEKAGEYSDLIKSLNASAQLHPTAEAIGELAGMSLNAPEALSNLYRTGSIAAQAGGVANAAKVVGKIVGGAAASGAAFEGVLRPAFDAARYAVADQLGIQHDAFQSPTLSSLATNVALGVMTAGHNIQFRDYTPNDIASILTRAKIRENAGIGLSDKADPAAMAQAISALGADSQQAAHLSQPLTAEEAHVFKELDAKARAMKASGAFDDATIKEITAKQAVIPKAGSKQGAPLTAASIETERPGAGLQRPMLPEGTPPEKPVAGRVVEPTEPPAGERQTESPPAEEQPKTPVTSSEGIAPVEPAKAEAAPQAIPGLEPTTQPETEVGKGLLHDSDAQAAESAKEGEQVRSSPMTPEAKTHASTMIEGLQDGDVITDPVTGQRAVVSRSTSKKSGRESINLTTESGEPLSGSSRKEKGGEWEHDNAIINAVARGKITRPSTTESEAPEKAPVEPQVSAKPEGVEQGASAEPTPLPAKQQADLLAERLDLLNKPQSPENEARLAEIAKQLPEPKAEQPAASEEPVQIIPGIESKGEPIPPEPSAVPELTSTEHAVKVGKAGLTDEQRTAFNDRRKEILKQAGKMPMGDEKVALITKAQLYREAVEASKEKAPEEAGETAPVAAEKPPTKSKKVPEISKSFSPSDALGLVRQHLEAKKSQLGALGVKGVKYGNTDAESGIEYDADAKTLHINPEKFARSLNTIRENQKALGIKATAEDTVGQAVFHELTHAGQAKLADEWAAKSGTTKAAGKSTVEQYYEAQPAEAFDKELMAAAKEAYGPEFDALPEGLKRAEAVRMVLERKWHGRITEALWKLIQPILDLLKKAATGEWMKGHLAELEKEMEGRVEKAPVAAKEEKTTEPPPKAIETVKPAEATKTPPEILNTARRVKVTAPEGATQLRVIDQKGRQSIVPLSVLQKGDSTLKGAGPFKFIHAGTIGKDGKFKLVKGDVGVTDADAAAPGEAAPVVAKQQAPVSVEPEVTEKDEQAVSENPFDSISTSRRLTELQKEKPRPVDKLYGKNVTQEQRSSQEEKLRKWNSEYRKALAAHKEAVLKSNEWIARQAEPVVASKEQAQVEEAEKEISKEIASAQSKPVAKDIRDKIVAQLNREAAKAPPKLEAPGIGKPGKLGAPIEISIPGDGTFKIARNKEALEFAAKQLAKISTTPGAIGAPKIGGESGPTEAVHYAKQLVERLGTADAIKDQEDQLKQLRPESAAAKMVQKTLDEIPRLPPWTKALPMSSPAAEPLTVKERAIVERLKRGASVEQLAREHAMPVQAVERVYDKAVQAQRLGMSMPKAEEQARSWNRLKTGDAVDGLEIQKDVPNTSSIAASLPESEEIGVREVPMSIFKLTPKEGKLADTIRESGKIKPLIVVVDGHEDGPAYILEGAHRFDALAALGKTSFPALVVIDREALPDQPTIPQKGDQVRDQITGKTGTVTKVIGGKSVVALDEGGNALFLNKNTEITNENRSGITRDGPSGIGESERGTKGADASLSQDKPLASRSKEAGRVGAHERGGRPVRGDTWERSENAGLGADDVSRPNDGEASDKESGGNPDRVKKPAMPQPEPVSREDAELIREWTRKDGKNDDTMGVYLKAISQQAKEDGVPISELRSPVQTLLDYFGGLKETWGKGERAELAKATLGMRVAPAWDAIATASEKLWKQAFGDAPFKAYRIRVMPVAGIIRVDEGTRERKLSPALGFLSYATEPQALLELFQKSGILDKEIAQAAWQIQGIKTSPNNILAFGALDHTPSTREHRKIGEVVIHGGGSVASDVQPEIPANISLDEKVTLARNALLRVEKAMDTNGPINRDIGAGARIAERRRSLDQKLPDFGREGKSNMLAMPMPQALQKGNDKFREMVEAVTAPFADVAKGVQSLVAPAALSLEHKEAAVDLGRRLGEAGHRQESDAATLKPDWRRMERMGVSNERLPLEKNPGILFWDRIAKGQKQPTPELQRMADYWKQKSDERLALLEKADAGLSKEAIRENYAPGQWTTESRLAMNHVLDKMRENGSLPANFDINNVPDALSKQIVEKVKETQREAEKSGDAAAFYGRRPLKGKESFRKEKVFKNHLAAVRVGLEPVFANPVDSMKAKFAEMDKSIMANQFLRDQEKKGRVINVNNSGEPMKKADRVGFEISEWRKIPDQYGDIWHTNEEGGKEKMGERWAKKPVADILDNFLSQSLYNNRYFGSLYKGWMFMANALNQTQLGVGSAFHAGFTTMEAQVQAGGRLMQDLFGVLRGSRSGKQLFETMKAYPTAFYQGFTEGDKILNAWRDPDGTMDPRIQQIVRATELAGGHFNIEQGLQTEEADKAFRDWYSDHRLRAAARSPVAAVEMMAKPIMDYLVPRQKAAVWAMKVQRIIEQNPGVRMEDLAGQFRTEWNNLDAAMGQIGYRRLFMNETAKNVVQGLVRAPGWSGGTIALLGGAFKDAGAFFREWQKTGTIPKELPPRVGYAISLLLTASTANAILTYLLTGKNPKGNDYLAFRTGKLDEQGNSERMVLPTYAKDLWAYSQDPGKTLLAKSHPLLSVFGDLIRNKDYYGVQISDPDANYAKQAMQKGAYVAKAFEPFWIRGLQQERMRQSGTAEKLLPLIGVMPAPKEMNMTAAEKVARAINVAKLPAEPITEQQSERRIDKTRLVVAARHNDTSEINSLLQHGMVTPKDVVTAEKTANMTPLQAAVRFMTPEQVQRVYNAADAKEKQEIRPILIQKQARAARESMERPVFQFQ